MSRAPAVSKSMRATDAPCIVKMQDLTRGKDVASLAQGIVHWLPPAEALEAAQRAVCGDASCHGYGADAGLEELRCALKRTLAEEKGLRDVEVMVTSGCNQAFTNVALTLLDSGDRAVVFRPYYFNHLMQLRMLGVEAALPEMTSALVPDLEAARRELEAGAKAVILVNPGNPTGTMIPEPLLRDLADACAEHGAWLVVDNTYELFSYDAGAPHVCVSGPHVVNLFSFSKAYGMMGWRVGYIAHHPSLGDELLKAQDTVAICPAIASQKIALAALEGRKTFVADRIRGLVAHQKPALLSALEPLGPNAVYGGDGAIYLLVKLPNHARDDARVVEWLVNNHGIATIPGSACGFPGFIRVCYANLPPPEYAAACARLRRACEALADPQVDIGL